MESEHHGLLPTTPKETARSSDLIGYSSRCFWLMSKSRLIGDTSSPLSCLHIGQQSFHPTGVSPVQLLHVWLTTTDSTNSPNNYPRMDSYHAQLKLVQLCDFVETHLTEAAYHQKKSYDQHARLRSFQVVDSVWLSDPTAGKLDPQWDPQWEGGWVIVQSKGQQHTLSLMARGENCSCELLQRHIQAKPETLRQETTTWQPPLIHHDIITDNPASEPRYPTCTRPLDWLQL